MFNVTVIREKTDGDMASDDYEGVVDMKVFPNLGKCRLEMKDGSDETVPYDTLHAESPIK